MSTPLGQKPAITARDKAILQDLYLADWATTDQLVRWHFPSNSPRRAYNRLRDLRVKRLLTNIVMPTGGEAGEPARISFWALTKEGRARVRSRLQKEGLTLARLFAEPPDASGRSRQTNAEFAGLDDFDEAHAYHLRSISELYGDLKGPLLVSYGGPEDGWLWRNERRSYIPWGDTAAHHFRPDAELVLDYPLDTNLHDEPDRFHLYFEVQTARSKRSERELARRINNHFLATQLAGFPDAEDRLLVFVGESASHIRVAHDTAARLGLPNLCGPKAAVLPVLRDTISAVASGRSPVGLDGHTNDTPPAAATHDAATPRLRPTIA